MINKNRVIERRVESRDPQRLDRRQLKEGTVGRKLQDARDFLKKAHEYRLMRMMKTEKYLAQELSQKLMRYNEMIRDPELDINQKAIVAEKMLNYISQIQLVQERMRDSTYSTIDGAIERINEKMLAHADNIASRDKLTQLKNEERFMHDVKQHIEDSKESIVFYIDVNNLKVVNDTGGHYAGDTFIKTMSEAMIETARRFNLDIGRLHGDELVMSISRKVSIPSKEEKDIINTLRQIFRELWGKKYQSDEKLKIVAKDKDTAIELADFAIASSRKTELSKYRRLGHDIKDTLETLISIADKKMYINKNTIKCKKLSRRITELKDLERKVQLTEKPAITERILELEKQLIKMNEQLLLSTQAYYNPKQK